MKKLPKLETFPLEILRLKSSDAWRKHTLVFGWYLRLLIQLADSPTPGYLPNDLVRLCELANGWEADSKPRDWKNVEDQFRQTWSAYLSSKFPTCDGGFVYNPRLLTVMESHSGECDVKTQRVPPTPPSQVCVPVLLTISNNEELENLFGEAYKAYPRHCGKRAAEKAFRSATYRLAKQNKTSPIEAAKYITEKSTRFAQSPAGQRGVHTPHMSSWLGADRFLDDPAEWGRMEEKQSASKQRITRNLEVIEQTFAGLGEGDDVSDAAEMAPTRP